MLTAVLERDRAVGVTLLAGSAVESLVEALLRRGAAADLDAAQAAVDWLVSVPTEPGYVLYEIPLLRLRALLASPPATMPDIGNYRDRYRPGPWSRLRRDTSLWLRRWPDSRLAPHPRRILLDTPESVDGRIPRLIGDVVADTGGRDLVDLVDLHGLPAPLTATRWQCPVRVTWLPLPLIVTALALQASSTDLPFPLTDSLPPAGVVALLLCARPETPESNRGSGRWEFEGDIALDVRDEYVGRSVGKGVRIRSGT